MQDNDKQHIDNSNNTMSCPMIIDILNDVVLNGLPINPKVYRRAFSEKNLSNFTHDSMYGALCTISVQNFNF